MQLREIGKSGLRVSPLALGTMGFGADWHGVGAIDEKTARTLVDFSVERGVNFIDTADIYGRGASETMLGKILQGRRDKFVISTKVLGEMRPGDPSSRGLSARHIAEGLEDSLKRLKTDYVDLYMPHDTDPSVPLEESLGAFENAVKAGKLRVLGCSNFQGREWERCLGWAKNNKAARMEFNEIQLSLAAPDCEDDLAPVCQKEKLSVLAWSPLGGGLLSGKYMKSRPAGRRKDAEKAFPYFHEAKLAPMLELLKKVSEMEEVSMAQAALGWVIGKPWVASALVAARTVQQLEETLLAKPLSAKAQLVLDKAARAVLGR